MSMIPELAAELARKEAVLNRINPRLAELRYLLGVTTGDPQATPDEWRAEQARLHAERAALASDIQRTREELGALENHARQRQERMALLDADIARLSEEAPPRLAALNADAARSLRRERDAHQQALDRIGAPRQVLASDAMKVGV